MPAQILTSNVSTINIIPVFTCGPILDIFLLTALLFTFFRAVCIIFQFHQALLRDQQIKLLLRERIQLSIALPLGTQLQL